MIIKKNVTKKYVSVDNAENISSNFHFHACQIVSVLVHVFFTLEHGSASSRACTLKINGQCLLISKRSSA